MGTCAQLRPGLKELGLQDQEGQGLHSGRQLPGMALRGYGGPGCRAIAVGIYPTNVAEQCFYVLDNSDSSMVVCKDQEQVDKILEIKDRLPT